MISYLFATFHPLKSTLRTYTARLVKYSTLFDGTGEKFSGWIKVVTMVGVIYYTGAITNATSYWFLEGTHSQIVFSAHSKIDFDDLTSNGLPPLGLVELAEHPFVCLCGRAELHTMDHARALRYDALWRNANGEGARASLDHMVRTLRLLRGTVLLGNCYGLIASLKVLISTALIVMQWVSQRVSSPTLKKVTRWSYVMVVDDDLYEGFKEQHDSHCETATCVAKDISPREMARQTIKYMLAPNLILAACALVVYLIAIGAWQSQEVEYHRLVQYGAESAVEVIRIDGPAHKSHDVPPRSSD